MKITKATREYEDWLGRRLKLVPEDIELKHRQMKAEFFSFLRATYYRWAQMWPRVCPELAKAPRVLAVGDLHIENFGTWRDLEGRLIWGVNDFDEAYPLSYVNDLVRLGVSAHLAVLAGHLALKHKDICDSILEGYRAAMRNKGRPFVLAEDHTWLREIAEGELRDPVRFWTRLDSIPEIKTKQKIPMSAIDAIEHLMPGREIDYHVGHRVAGLGSLGRMRFVAIANWHGGQIAREAKAMAPSANSWVEGDRGSIEIFYQTLIDQAVRCPDPFVHLRGRWIVRRLGPLCSRIELESLKAPSAELRLLHAMGAETANIHLGTKAARKRVLRHIDKQKGRWLHKATLEMLEAVRSDWEAWQKDGWI